MSHKLTVTLSVLLLGTTALQGCSYIPDLDLNAKTVIPETYPDDGAYDPQLSNAEQAALSEMDWQDFYQDETLKTLIAIGLENNRDLKTATLNIREARALYNIQESELYPDIAANASYTRQKGASSNAAAAAGGAGFGGINDYYRVGLGITAYELDLFGRVRSLNEAALNDYFATMAAQKAVQTALVANIARAYASLKADEALLDVANETVEAQAQAHDIIQLRLNEGIGTGLDLAQAETLLEQARADRYQYLAAVEQDQNALRLLLGTPRIMPDTGDIGTLMMIDGLMADVPVGLPSELLTVRPDIIQAEYQLRSANADIGAARAAFFPTISLTATGGYASAELGNLFEANSQVWQFAPQITVPIFTWGQLENQLDVTEIRKNRAVVNYEQSIETAFREVADALADVSTYQNRVEATANVVQATQKSARLSQLRYDEGIDNYLAVLDANQQLYRAQQNLILQKAGQVTAKINLYQSVGGGADL